MSDFVVSLGPLAKNNEWYLGVNSSECRDELIKCGILDVNGRRFKIRSTDDTRFEFHRVIKIGPTIDMSQSWKWIHCDFVNPIYTDLAWRITHQILPTQCLIYEYNIYNMPVFICVKAV